MTRVPLVNFIPTSLSCILSIFCTITNLKRCDCVVKDFAIPTKTACSASTGNASLRFNEEADTATYAIRGQRCTFRGRGFYEQNLSCCMSFDGLLRQLCKHSNFGRAAGTKGCGGQLRCDSGQE